MIDTWQNGSTVFSPAFLHIKRQGSWDSQGHSFTTIVFCIQVYNAFSSFSWSGSMKWLRSWHLHWRQWEHWLLIWWTSHIIMYRQSALALNPLQDYEDFAIYLITLLCRQRSWCFVSLVDTSHFPRLLPPITVWRKHGVEEIPWPAVPSLVDTAGKGSQKLNISYHVRKSIWPILALLACGIENKQNRPGR